MTDIKIYLPTKTQVDTILSTIGNSSDSGGSISSGTINGKLNKVIDTLIPASYPKSILELIKDKTYDTFRSITRVALETKILKFESVTYKKYTFTHIFNTYNGTGKSTKYSNYFLLDSTTYPTDEYVIDVDVIESAVTAGWSYEQTSTVQENGNLMIFPEISSNILKIYGIYPRYFSNSSSNEITYLRNINGEVKLKIKSVSV